MLDTWVLLVAILVAQSLTALRQEQLGSRLKSLNKRVGTNSEATAVLTRAATQLADQIAEMVVAQREHHEAVRESTRAMHDLIEYVRVTYRNVTGKEPEPPLPGGG